MASRGVYYGGENEVVEVRWFSNGQSGCSSGRNEDFFYCRVNELMVRSSIEAFAIKVTFPIRAG